MSNSKPRISYRIIVNLSFHKPITSSSLILSQSCQSENCEKKYNYEYFVYLVIALDAVIFENMRTKYVNHRIPM